VWLAENSGEDERAGVSGGGSQGDGCKMISTAHEARVCELRRPVAPGTRRPCEIGAWGGGEGSRRSKLLREWRGGGVVEGEGGGRSGMRRSSMIERRSSIDG
jgi:hypothetical protein